jgi:hypothetical protein
MSCKNKSRTRTFRKHVNFNLECIYSSKSKNYIFLIETGGLGFEFSLLRSEIQLVRMFVLLICMAPSGILINY